MNFTITQILIIGLIFIVLLFALYIISKRQHRHALIEASKNLDKEKALNKELKEENDQLIDSNNNLSIKLNTAEVHVEHLTQDNKQLNVTINDLNNRILNTEYQYNDINTKLSNQMLENSVLRDRLNEEKIEKEELNQRLKSEFENLANKILEEKSTRFTLQNKENLDQILKPFQQRIDELKKTVNETYDKESKQRFSLGEKVRELALLNQQISDDAKKLTRALRSENKTQGNWGEMILESILEKSGLVKGREYFMEYQLKDENNKALLSEFSGKKMRPDAIVKYPDQRNVIIDSKVSLKDFLDSVDETDEEIYQIKITKHLKSIKNHIQQLSQKAYDDYDKTLDFVMMFIPSESAYIAAMQADPNLWEYAYEKRVLLLNPSNLITSLKLLADLWKRDYQNKNAMQIAQKGAQLYDKFVGFIQNLEEVGKHMDKAQNSYETAFKQLSTGRNNLVNQAHKLKELGIKNKKQMPKGLIDRANQPHTDEE